MSRSVPQYQLQYIEGPKVESVVGGTENELRTVTISRRLIYLWLGVMALLTLVAMYAFAKTG